LYGVASAQGPSFVQLSYALDLVAWEY